MSQSDPTPADGEKGSTSLWRSIIRHPFRNWLDVNPDLLELARSIPVDPNETGLDRLKESWRRYIQGDACIEFHMVINTVGMAAMTGFIFGGISDIRPAMQDFTRKHNANIFYGNYRANRMLADTIYVEFFRRGIGQAIKYSLFSGLFVGMLAASATYRNDIYFSDCALGGALTGAVWKVQLGPRAMLVNGVVGSIFGLCFASIMKLTMKLGNTSIREMRFYHNAIHEDDTTSGLGE